MPTLLSNLQPFGVLLAAGIGVGLLLADRLARAAGLDRELGAAAFVTAAVAALAGGRILYVVGSPEHESALEVLALGRGGLSGYGALLAGAAVFGWVISRGPDSAWAWLDVAAPGLLVAAAVARLGCLLTGCDFGVPAENAVLRRFALSPATGEAAHPTQLYEAALLLTLCVSAVFARRLQRRSGQLFIGCSIAYAIVRFSLEPLRADADRGFFGVLTLTQWCALLALAATAAAWFWARQRLPSSN